jgi:VanZ family protein
VLGAISFAAFFPMRNKALRLFTSVGFCFLYACTDEIHQTFIPDRAGKFSDVLIDTCGSTFGAVIMLILVIVIEAWGIIRENKKNGGKLTRYNP